MCLYIQTFPSITFLYLPPSTTDDAVRTSNQIPLSLEPQLQTPYHQRPTNHSLAQPSTRLHTPSPTYIHPTPLPALTQHIRQRNIHNTRKKSMSHKHRSHQQPQTHFIAKTSIQPTTSPTINAYTTSLLPLHPTVPRRRETAKQDSRMSSFALTRTTVGYQSTLYAL